MEPKHELPPANNEDRDNEIKAIIEIIGEGTKVDGNYIGEISSYVNLTNEESSKLNAQINSLRVAVSNFLDNPEEIKYYREEIAAIASMLAYGEAEKAIEAIGGFTYSAECRYYDRVRENQEKMYIEELRNFDKELNNPYSYEHQEAEETAMETLKEIKSFVKSFNPQLDTTIVGVLTRYRNQHNQMDDDSIFNVPQGGIGFYDYYKVYHDRSAHDPVGRMMNATEYLPVYSDSVSEVVPNYYKSATSKEIYLGLYPVLRAKYNKIAKVYQYEIQKTAGCSRLIPKDVFDSLHKELRNIANEQENILEEIKKKIITESQKFEK